MVKIKILSVILFSISLIYAQQNLISIQISLDKTDITIAEPIGLTVSVTNNSQHIIEIDKDFICNKIKLKEPGGRYLEPNGKFNKIRIKNFIPGQSAQFEYELNSNFGTIDSIWAIHFHQGNYSVQVIDRKRLDNELIDIFSNVITFNVNKPQGENIETLKLLSTAGKYKIQNQKHLALINYDKIINEYPNSVHRERALLKAGYIYRYSNDDSLSNISFERFSRLVNEYPNSYYYKTAFAAIVFLYRPLDDRNDGISFLENLISTHPNTKVGNMAQEILNKAMHIPEEKWDFKK